MGQYTVYRIQNIMSGNFYIGVTRNYLQKRMAQHLRELDKSIKSTDWMDDYNKYGRDSFIMGEIISLENLKDAQVIEKALIQIFNPFYNIMTDRRMKDYNRIVIKDNTNENKKMLTIQEFSMGYIKQDGSDTAPASATTITNMIKGGIIRDAELKTLGMVTMWFIPQSELVRINKEGTAKK